MKYKNCYALQGIICKREREDFSVNTADILVWDSRQMITEVVWWYRCIQVVQDEIQTPIRAERQSHKLLQLCTLTLKWNAVFLSNSFYLSCLSGLQFKICGEILYKSFPPILAIRRYKDSSQLENSNMESFSITRSTIFQLTKTRKGWCAYYIKFYLIC